MPRGGYEPDRNNLAPRVGFAWTLDQSARTVLRGGYGIYYNQGALATSEGLYFNPPYFNLSVYFPAPGLPPLTLADPFPASFPVFIPQSATAYPARSADAVDGALERQRAASVRTRRARSRSPTSARAATT